MVHPSNNTIRSYRECLYCGDTQGPLTIDHAYRRGSEPAQRLGRNNLLPACRACNEAKADSPLLFWLWHLRLPAALAEIPARVVAYCEHVEQYGLVAPRWLADVAHYAMHGEKPHSEKPCEPDNARPLLRVDISMCHECGEPTIGWADTPLGTAGVCAAHQPPVQRRPYANARDPMAIKPSTGWGFHREQDCRCYACAQKAVRQC